MAVESLFNAWVGRGDASQVNNQLNHAGEGREARARPPWTAEQRRPAYQHLLPGISNVTLRIRCYGVEWAQRRLASGEEIIEFAESASTHQALIIIVDCDVTKGNNASHPEPGVGYQAGRGFNAVSGWGVPDGDGLRTARAAV